MSVLQKHLYGDKMIWYITLTLSSFSLLAVYSATATLAYSNNASPEYYLLRQLVLLLIGFGITYIAHLINYNYYSRVAQVLLYLSFPLLFITLFAGTDINEARRWLNIPIVNISFQTSDLAKLALIMYTARMLSKRQHVIKDFDRAFMPMILPMVGICLLIVRANLSTASVLFMTNLILMFIGRISLRHIGLTLGFGLAAFLMFLGIATLTSYKGRIDTWKSRIEKYVNSNDTPQEDYQTTNAFVAVANGGLVRFAPGKSTQCYYLPQPYSDYIYAIIIEEYGLLGGAFVLILYLSFLYRCILIFIKSPGAFGAFLAVGLSLSMVIQALMDMAVTVGLLPVTGLPLPLVSMGGTSLLFTSFAIGVILSVSRQIETVKEEDN